MELCSRLRFQGSVAYISQCLAFSISRLRIVAIAGVTEALSRSSVPRNNHYSKLASPQYEPEAG